MLPIGIILSWLVIPNPVPVKILPATNVELLPVIQDKKETPEYCLNLRSNNDKTSWQLEWKNRLELTTPSAVIYKAPPPPQGGMQSFSVERAELIGRIEARGDYVFPLKVDSTKKNELNLVVYDFIHEKIIDSLTLKTSRQ